MLTFRLRVGLRAALSLVAASAGLVAVPGPLPAAAAACTPASGVAVPDAPRPSGSYDVLVRGHGWGHSMGMSQYGAQGAATLGCTAAQILGYYYAGTVVAARTMPAEVRVSLMAGGSSARVLAENGTVTWQLTGCTAGCPPAQPAGAHWQVQRTSDGARYWLRNVADGATVWAGGSSGAELRAHHSGTVVSVDTPQNDRRLRWDYTRFLFSGSALDAMEVITTTSAGSAMDKYLWGIAEVPVSWPDQALRAQAIAARTYAAKRPGAVLQPTPADQNYLGYAQEAEDARFGSRWRTAVNATSTLVVVLSADGSLVDALYSSSFGGRSEDRRYVWGAPEIPYLRSVDDSRWEMASSNPSERRSWARGFTFAQLTTLLQSYASAHGLPVPGAVTGMSVAAPGSSARLSGVRVVGRYASGTAYDVAWEGWDVRQALGLLSPGFGIEIVGTGWALTGDWDGDGATDLGWYRDGAVALRLGSGSVVRFRYGNSGMRPIAGDWNGDGRDEIGVVIGNQWHLRYTLTSGVADRVFAYGRAGDIPVVGDWDGDGGDGAGVVRSNVWYLRNTVGAGSAELTFAYGFTAGRNAVLTGDWDGNGTETPAIRRSNTWYLRNSNTAGTANLTFTYGPTTGVPAVVGDWNGDARTTIGVVLGTDWHLRNENSGGPAGPIVVFAG
jgi:stage II sporulation protein D